MKDTEIIVPELNEQTIKSKIYEIRGQKVMLDYELAEIYGYTTKAFNQQVRRNNEVFPDESFMFKMSKNDYLELVRSQIVTSRIWENGNEGGRRYLPYAFTEKGIYMLMTVLKGELAIKQHIALVNLFEKMKNYINSNSLVGVNEVIKLANTVNEHSLDISDIKSKLGLVMENFIDPSTYKHFLILDGEKIEADVAYQQIYKMAKQSLYIIDDYVDAKTLQLLKIANVKDMILFTDNKSKSGITPQIIKDSGLDITIKHNSRVHDRYIIIDYNTKDEKIYHCGASSKDAGNKVTTIMKIEEPQSYHKFINEMILNN